MRDKINLEKEYGIVLEGGGAKGAYQIGVWKALKEYGVKIKGIAGVSVGALNGVLMCMDDVEHAEEIWNNISYSSVMDVNDEDMGNILRLNLKELNLKNITSTGVKVVASGGFDITPLRNLLQEHVDEEKVRNSDIELYMGTLNFSDRKGMEIDAKTLRPGEICDYLIASASLPLFKQEKLQGKTYLDGGLVNNVPTDMLIKRGYKDIIVIRIYGIGVERKVKIPEDVTVIEIAPRVELGSILEFEGKKTQRNIKIGYYDGMRALRNLQGKIYYLDEIASEEEHFLKFYHLNSAAQMAVMEYFKEDYDKRQLYPRKMFEKVLPQIAEKLGLSKDWTYTELYICMLELTAKRMRVQKYHIYTENEFHTEIKNNYAKNGMPEEKIDMFTQLIIKAMVIGD